MTPWWWYVPIVGYLIVAHRCAQTQRAVQAYHDRGEAAPRAAMQANATAYEATYTALLYTFVWLVGTLVVLAVLFAATR